MRKKDDNLDMGVRIRRMVLSFVRSNPGKSGADITRGIWKGSEVIRKRHKNLPNFYRCVTWHLKKLYEHNYVYFREEEKRKTSAPRKFWHPKRDERRWMK